MDLINIIDSIYKKDKIIIDKVDIGLCIALNNVLRLNMNNLIYLKKILKFMFYIEPKRYLMLLFIIIPQNNKPYFKGVKKSIEQKEDKLYNKIVYIFNWSFKELKRQKPILDRTINREYWSKILAIE